LGVQLRGYLPRCTQAVFNYDFNSLTTDSPIIQAVYTALKETESRATDLFPYWKVL